MTLNNVPNPGQTLSNSQPLINQNFVTIDTAFAVDHVPYTSTNPVQGKHKKVTFPPLTTSPAMGFVANEVGLYNVIGIAQYELWINKTNLAGIVNFPMTQSSLSNTTPTAGQAGWTYLPSGMLLITGSVDVTGLATVTITIPVTWTTLLMVVVSPFSTGTSDANRAVSLQGIGTAASLLFNQFSVFASNRTSPGPATTGMSFIALGY